jgi:hypothetical protein
MPEIIIALKFNRLYILEWLNMVEYNFLLKGLS